MQEAQTDGLIKVKYRDKSILSLTYTGDWVDVRVSAITSMKANSTSEELLMSKELDSTQPINISRGSSIKIWHGFCLELPKNYEAILLPRGSLFKNSGLIFTCSGVIDEGYKGNTDEWFSTYYATKDTLVYPNDRVAQFRIQEKQPRLLFTTVETLESEDRGGHGSTGGYTTLDTFK